MKYIIAAIRFHITSDITFKLLVAKIMHACCVPLIGISFIVFVLLLFVSASSLHIVDNFISQLVPTVGRNAQARDAANRPAMIRNAEYDD